MSSFCFACIPRNSCVMECPHWLHEQLHKLFQCGTLTKEHFVFKSTGSKLGAIFHKMTLVSIPFDETGVTVHSLPGVTGMSMYLAQSCTTHALFLHHLSHTQRTVYILWPTGCSINFRFYSQQRIYYINSLQLIMLSTWSQCCGNCQWYHQLFEGFQTQQGVIYHSNFLNPFHPNDAVRHHL